MSEIQSSEQLCPSCQYRQSAEYSYCGHCGQQLKKQCGQCQQLLPWHFHFCGFCGASFGQAEPTSGLTPPLTHTAPEQQEASLSVPLEEPVPAASSSQLPLAHPRTARSKSNIAQSAVARVSERRQVAVLFCDLCGFTAMSEKLDPEEVSNIIQPLFQQCNAAINKYGGVVEKFIGDAIMALFGVPYANEDDAERAAMAALELRTLIQAYGQELYDAHGFRVNMRIGLNVGTVVAGSVEAVEGKNYQVMGDAINTAARMEQNARPGHILVTEEMYHQIQDSFDLVPDQPIQAKGKAEPLQAYELLGIRRLRQRERGRQGQEVPMVNRDEEMQALKRLAQNCFQNRQTQSVLISGISGLGKTRLARELFAQLQEEHPEIRLLEGNGTSYSQDFTYFTLQNLLRSVLDIDETASTVQAVEKIQTLLDRIQIPNSKLTAHLLEYVLYPHLEIPQLRFIAPQRLQTQIFKAVRDVLRALAKNQALVILIDDLQWCDELSLQCLQTLQELSELPLFLCFTCRQEASHSPQTPLSWTEHIHLEPLPTHHCKELMARILECPEGTPPHLAALEQQILKRAAGNPYYIEEVLINLFDEELLIRDAQSWNLTCELKDLPLPGSIQRLLISRFDRLESSQRHILQTLSVLARPTELSLLEELLQIPAVELQPELELLIQQGFVVRSLDHQGKQVYGFAQALSAEVVYNTLLRRRKHQLHQQIGELLEQRNAGHLHQALDLLAYHFAHTDDLTRATRYLLVAAEQASRLNNNLLALEHYNQVLEILPQMEADTLVGVDLYQQQWKLAEQVRLQVARQRCELLLLTSAYDEVMESVDALLKEELPPVERARLLYCRGRVLEKRSEFEASREVYQEAQSLLAGQGQLREEARLWNAIGWVFRWTNDYDAAMEACESALKLLQREPDMEQLAYAHNVLSVVHYYRHDWEKSREHSRHSMKIQKQIHDLWGLANSLSNLGNVHVMTNRWSEAIAVFKESLEIRNQLGDLEGQATSCNNLGHALQEIEDHAEAERYIERALSLYTHLGHAVGMAISRCSLGTVYFRQHKTPEASEMLNLGIEAMEAKSMEAMLPEVYNHRIELHLQDDNVERALQFLERDQEKIEEHGDPIQKGRLQRLWGDYHYRKQNWEQASEFLQSALQALQSTGHRHECLALYQLLARLHRAQDSEQAQYWEEEAQSLKPVEIHVPG